MPTQAETKAARAMQTWMDAERRAQAMWRNPNCTAQEADAAAWQAACARQQMADACAGRPVAA